MIKISLCMIVKDEESVLARCLDSVKDFVGEIVIVDTGSEDGTPKIAERYTDRIFHFEWCDDFAAARNFAFSKATGDYLMWLDADDVVPNAKAEFPALYALLGKGPDAVTCPYRAGGTVFFRERFLRREAGFLWEGRVHECIALRGNILRSELKIVHMGSEKERGTRNLDIYRKWETLEALSPRHLFYYGRELFYNGEFEEASAMLEKMLGGDGWAINKIEGCKILSECRVALGDRDGAREALLRSFFYGAPRASVLCALGNCSQAEGRYRDAVFWYRAAMLADDHSGEGDFEEPACRGLVPLLELVVCYWKLGEREKALECHKKTEELAPQHPSVTHNRTFFGN